MSQVNRLSFDTARLCRAEISFVAALTQTATAQKTNRNWLVFAGCQTTTVGRDPIAPKYSCESSGIYAPASFAAPVILFLFRSRK